MKELTIEEKAKRYDKAIERAKEYWDVDIDNTMNVCAKGTMEYLFPELKESKESEDDRIRKNCIHFLELQKQHHAATFEIEECIAWLEKQGEHANFRNNIQIGDKVTRNEDGVLVNLSQLNRVAKKDEKQGEKNPILPKWKYKKDHTPLLRDSLILNKYGCVAKSPSGALVSDVWVIDYDELAKLPKEEIEHQGEQKPTNSIIEEEKPLLEKFRQAVYDCAWGKVTCKKEGETKEEYANRWAEQFLLIVRDWADDYIDFTIQQKLRNSYEKGKTDIIEKQGEHKPAFSEEEKESLELLVNYISSLTDVMPYNITIPPYNNRKRMLNFLKSLKERYTWKPSDEQIKALEYYLRNVIDKEGVFGRKMIELYEDLWNLREE